MRCIRKRSNRPPPTDVNCSASYHRLGAAGPAGGVLSGRYIVAPRNDPLPELGNKKKGPAKADPESFRRGCLKGITYV
jgi:hypothetical protein